MRNIVFLLFFLVVNIYAQTIKDISNIVGIRENQLIGYGLVVGLKGSGDKSQFTMQSLQNLLRNSYIKIPTSSIKSKNIAAVMITSSLPPFARQGDKINIKVSAIGDAKSIDQGELLLTQLKGVDGTVYALAQGKVLGDKNNQTTGIIYSGATVENEIPFTLANENSLTISLISNDAQTASLVETNINKRFGLPLAYAVDTRTIMVQKPSQLSMVRFLAIIQGIKVEAGIRGKIIIDLNKETVVAGSDIKIKPVTVARESFTLKIKHLDIDERNWNDPVANPGVDIGDGVKVGNEPIQINLNNALVNSKSLPTVSDLIRALKIMKIDISDIIETIRMVKDLGAIDADLEIRE